MKRRTPKAQSGAWEFKSPFIVGRGPGNEAIAADGGGIRWRRTRFERCRDDAGNLLLDSDGMPLVKKQFTQRGKPSARMPIEVDVIAAEHRFAVEQRKIAEHVAKVTGQTSPAKSAAGKSSGAARQGRKQRLEVEVSRLTVAGMATRNAKSKAAKTVGVSARHARRVMQKK
jgi:hypothetical protein